MTISFREEFSRMVQNLYSTTLIEEKSKKFSNFLLQAEKICKKNSNQPIPAALSIFRAVTSQSNNELT